MDYHNSWKNFIIKSKFLEEMTKFVHGTKNICPSEDKVFRFLNCDISKTKYIILGMDPYASTYLKNGVRVPVATGRAFEVANVENFTDKYKQSSLLNIFKALCYYKYKKYLSIDELREKFKCETSALINTHYWFDAMEENGVIFLNSTLTTTIGKSGAHINEWAEFMNELILYIEKNYKCKWLIWGDKALNRIKNIVDNKNIIYSCHPASRINNDFVENNCFIKANEVKWF